MRTSLSDEPQTDERESVMNRLMEALRQLQQLGELACETADYLGGAEPRVTAQEGAEHWSGGAVGDLTGLAEGILGQCGAMSHELDRIARGVAAIFGPKPQDVAEAMKQQAAAPRLTRRGESGLAAI